MGSACADCAWWVGARQGTEGRLWRPASGQVKAGLHRRGLGRLEAVQGSLALIGWAQGGREAARKSG